MSWQPSPFPDTAPHRRLLPILPLNSSGSSGSSDLKNTHNAIRHHRVGCVEYGSGGRHQEVVHQPLRVSDVRWDGQLLAGPSDRPGDTRLTP
ncbi:MAG: hypothetical protein AB7N65_27470 [Vicinamibacterales bacterium]